MKPGTIILRADATPEIGTGHVMRCLALAQAWQDAGGDTVFCMARSIPLIQERLESENCRFVSIPGATGGEEDVSSTLAIAKQCEARWIVLDGYHFGQRYQQQIKQAGLKLLFLDDIGVCKSYSADIILNQNIHANERMYVGSQSYTRFLVGPRYALLRREFKECVPQVSKIREAGRNTLVSMGGADPENVTARVLSALESFDGEVLQIVVVVGPGNGHMETLDRLSSGSRHSVRLVRNPAFFVELMEWADVAISAAGSTVWEMCRLGLPAILVDIAENQRPGAEELARRGVALHLGSSHDINPATITRHLRELFTSKERCARMAQIGRELVDGRGSERVVAAIQSADLKLRRATEEDSPLLWQWVNDPAVRAASFSQAPIPWDEHQAWFGSRMNDPRSVILIAENDKGKALGQVRVDLRSEQEGEIDVTVSPEHRGEGYGSWIIELGVREAFANTKTRQVHAFVRPENKASLRAFEHAHFTRIGEEAVRGHQAVHYLRTRDSSGISKERRVDGI